MADGPTQEQTKKAAFAVAATSKYPNYLADRDLCRRFFEEFRDASGGMKYMDMAARVARRETNVFTVDLDDIQLYGQLYLAQRIQMNVMGYREEMYRVVDEIIPEAYFEEDMIDHLILEAQTAGQHLPPLLTRRYELVVMPLTSFSEPVPLRQLKGGLIGTLVVLRGICIAATAVRPKLSMLVSVCEVCAETTFQQVIGDRLTPLMVCQSQRCRLNNTVGRLLPQYKASKFTKHQELRLQELPQYVPRGAIPRTIRVICEGEQTRIATPGQVVKVVGTYCPDPSTGQGHEAFRASTMVKTLFRALRIELERRSYQEAADDLKIQVDNVKQHPDKEVVIEKLTRSVAPEIWGMEDVKKALLCLLVGGSSIANGIRIRSDTNICLMGDPGVAKSQLLKWIASVAPRSIFTTGKGSSGVGLTAAVTRDTYTGEVMLEGGALVLSDRGICCIDEFDKMDDSDRTALHEVMEQQMVSIAKAGIITSLNARTSILAAANPKYGRWRRNLTPSENVNLPPALLSRFDVLWLLLDESNRERDAELSMHVTYVHLHGVAPGTVSDNGFYGLSSDYFGKDFLQAYVGEAKKIHPIVDSSAAKVISDIYCEMRAQSVRHTNVVTARTLLSIIRLSQACARLRFSDRVVEADVREAGRLLDCSKISLQERVDTGGRRMVTTSDAAIFSTIKELARSRGSIDLAEVRPALMIKGIDESHLQRCLNTYADVGVWEVSGNTVHFSLE
ncbi:minichromosome maintenance (MCM) complex subunit,putative [Trypanosoma brucei gambiense DAL972]|uniref:DNA helicase n=1 Tax=Trypanosoma brucei gambiense (strain MHOM/CI/86/DAL972) TaxID=679716 RepID=D0AAI9_TRYB9|nr:minichromosome maintenance (MCM) complex subunit,putative [Trypanosoma brucei gambiense DAL972]CBH18690.1 minichromosome maintenance (MCM) complex subunit,putative [Trypanosoma brucei gambiense DAL972]|eukprot:XP_011780954.1 minichromosome maintenance (MCM) complex subunit,putative [Trypanosoma brucei gambiense DAL972]